MKTNNSMNIQNGVSSVPVYQRWYSSPKMVQQPVEEPWF